MAVAVQPNRAQLEGVTYVFETCLFKSARDYKALKKQISLKTAERNQKNIPKYGVNGFLNCHT